MDRLDDLAADLPPPRDDEPASLRRDILDELADHLACSLDRERQRQAALSAASENSPQERVLQRFGNPNEIARRLWWDAMGAKIMTQRILVGLMGVLTLACCVAVGGALWMVSRQQRDMAELARIEAQSKEEQRQHFERLLNDNRAASEQLVAQANTGTELIRKQLTEARETQGRLVARLDTLEKTAPPSDWNPAEFQLVLGAEGGPPAVGFKVSLTLTAEGAGIPPLRGTTDDTGRLRFERVRYGVYEFLCEAPWGERITYHLSIQPGEAFRESIICPPSAPESFTGRITLDLPEDLKSRPIYFPLSLAQCGRRYGGAFWSLNSGSNRGGRSFQSAAQELIMSSTGTLHSGRVSPSMSRSWLAVADDGRVIGVRLAGIDYTSSAPIEFYTPSDLKSPESLETNPSAPRSALERGAARSWLAGIPAATIPSDQAHFRRGAEGTLLLSMPDKSLAALREVFRQVDELREKGGEQISFDPRGNRDGIPLPPAIESVKDFPMGFSRP